MLRETPAYLLDEWWAAYKNEPFGDDWLQAAQIASIASASGFKKIIPVSDLIPNYKKPDGMNDEQITNVLESIRVAFEKDS